MYTFNKLRPSGHHVLNFVAIDLQLYKIFKITQVSFFGSHYVMIVETGRKAE